MNRQATAHAALPSGRLLHILATVIGTATVTAVIALLAAVSGFHRDEMLLVAGGVGCAAALPALFLLYRQMAGGEATQAADRKSVV